MTAEGNDRDAGVVEEITGYLASTPPQSFFLFAGAGSGKTRTLVETLRHLTGIEPHEAGSKFAAGLRSRGQAIRVITYTRNAVTVINGRLGENDLAAVSTIHSFCWDLIAGFDSDIRDALLALNAQELEEVKQNANARKKGPTAKDNQLIEDLEAKAQTIQTIPRFIYHPDRNTYGDGALQHAQVVSITAWLLEERPTLRRVLTDRHPVILIDESQDTMKKMLGALMSVAQDNPLKLALGFLGDHRQRIYLDGHQDLPGLIPAEWARPALKMNHRSQKRVVDLINHIWKADVEGRTQAATGVKQHSRTEKTGGTVRIFIGDASLPTDEKIRREGLCAREMAAASEDNDWLNPEKGYQVLALEHRLAARRGGFPDVYEALVLIDPNSARPQGSGDNAGPSAVQMLLREASALAACFGEQCEVDDFSVIEILQRYDRLPNLSTDDTARKEHLAELHLAIREFADLCSKPGATVRQILEPIVRSRLFKADERLLKAFQDPEPVPEAPARSSDESPEDRKRRGWDQLFNARWSELGRYRTYLDGRSNLSTHQVVKGSEFEHVLVVMDDQEAEGNLFSYDKLLGAIPLSINDLSNVAANKETSIDRTLRLLYVTCSRARESLALVLWSSAPEVAYEKIKAGGWFNPSEIQKAPET